MAANVFTIPAGAPFAGTLARGLKARLKADADPFALARATIFLPTRRAMRTLSDAFAHELGGAVLLPEIRALGDVDEDEFLFDAALPDLDLPPEIAPLRRRLLLATLIERWDRRQRDGKLSFAQAAALARALASFLDEVETQGADLAKLETLAPAALAAHWAEVKGFLAILHEQWPKLLEAEGALNPAARRNQALAALCDRYRTAPPAGPVIAAGSTGSIPATAELLKTIAHLPEGAVILPGLDRDLDSASWDSLDPGHPQFGMKQLLERIGVARDAVVEWDGTPARPRAALLRETLRPAPTTDAWRALAERGGDDMAKGLEGLSLVEAAHPGEEAAVIALMLREVLETPGQSAALVTPDRNLARRVASELRRWDIAIDDSAGKPLAHTPPGTFLCLLSQASESGFAPVPLLALLKHPLAACGELPAQFRARVRALDRFCLRGPRPDSGLDGIRRMIARAGQDERDDERRDAAAEIAPWFERVARLLSPLDAAMQADAIALSDMVALQVKSAEALAATNDEAGEGRLWCGEAGEAAAALVTALSERAADLPLMSPSSYPALFRALAEEVAVRSVRGRHPALAILGPLEARLQSFDLTVLGGLNEGTWPAAAAADAWLSRPMRQALGLEQPERRIGLSAHDFAALASGPRVVLTRAQKAEGSPTIAARWWQRLEQLTKGLGLHGRLAPSTDYVALARRLAEPERRSEPIKRPAPCPPVAARPRSLSVTEIETWLRDPYAIYAKHVLKLAPLDGLDAAIGPLERGTAVHAALERFTKEFSDGPPPEAALRLIDIAEEVFDELSIPRAARALWFPRFAHAAHWFVREERQRREAISRSHIEIYGRCQFAGPAGPFTLRARADRIDELKAGGAAVVDYKTGEPPTVKQVTTLLAPQLPLEGAILKAGGFTAAGELQPTELLYIRFGGGGAEPGELRGIAGDIAALVAEAEEKLLQRIADFDREDTAYLPRVKPFRADQPGDYDHLARVREWSLSGWEGEE
ncbi:MAG: double-strand break repair protein AddB [Alphaproteobacteria bacterium]|nr:double-strand break repair protein AddB [Alphaproteobacteria bacterium]